MAIILTGCQTTPSPTSQVAQNNGIEDVRVDVAEPTESLVDVEQFPLPNCGGTSELKQSLGTHASIFKSVTVSAKATTTGGAEVEIPETVKLKLEIEVELAYQQTYASANSRLDTIEMSAASGTHVVYVIEWYEQQFNSMVSYSADGEVYEVPYTYKLRIPKIGDSYKVECLGNSTVGNEQLDTSPTPESTSVQITVGKCPNTSEEAANLFGGTPSYWEQLSENAWKFGPAPGSPIQNLIIPEGMNGDWWDNYQAHSRLGPAEVGYTSEATIYCVP